MSYVWVEECFCEGALQFRVARRETRVTAGNQIQEEERWKQDNCYNLQVELKTRKLK